MITSLDSSQDNKFDIQSILFFLRRNYLKIIYFLIFSIILACIVTLNTKPVFKSTATVLIENDKGSDLSILGGTNPFFPNNILEDKIEILQSRTISESTIKKLINSKYSENLFILDTRAYQPVGSYRKTFSNLVNLGGFLDSEESEINSKYSDLEILSYAYKLQESIEINNTRETNILNISIESYDPNEAAIIVNTFVDSYIEQEKVMANQAIAQRIAFLEQQTEKKNIELYAIEDSVKVFQQKSGLYSVDVTSELLLNRLLDLDSQLVKQEIEYKDIVNRKKIYEQELGKKEIPKNYEIAIKDSLRKINILETIINDRIINLNKELNDHQNIVNSLPDKIIQFFRLERSRQMSNTTYSLMINNLEEAKIILESQTGSAVIIDYAVPNYNRIKPNLPSNLLLFSLLGIILSLIIISIIEFFNNSIKTVDELERYGLSIFSIIPSIKANKNNKKSWFNINSNPVNKKSVTRSLIIKEDPKSPISEAYRTLRTSLMYSKTKEMNTIMVSSPGPSEGKTTTIANLAITYASLGKKTLLIDADLRKPVINKVFKLSRDPGLTNYLVGESNSKEIIKDTSVDNLSIIPSGLIPPNPSELIDSDRMQSIIEELKKDFDIILFDTPPLIAVTDALILSKYINQFILVCRSGVTQVGALDRILKSVKQVDSKIDGCVLNDLDYSNSYGSNYYYNYYQYYANDE